MAFWLAVIGGVALALALTVWINHVFEGEWLPSDLWREWKMSRASLAELDRRWSANPSRSDIVVSLTTIPSRLAVIDDTLKSLLDQSRAPGRIILNVPRFSRRENTAYVVPDRLRRLASLEIRDCEDWGPATKIIPPLMTETSDQPILVVDDDRIYQPWMVERFEAFAGAHPGNALTLAGMIVPADFTDRPTTLASNLFKRPPAPLRAPRVASPQPVDILLGVFGYLVRPRFFDLAKMTDFEGEPPELRLVDDVRTSALCMADKLVIPGPSLSFIPKHRWFFYKGTALGRINKGKGGNEGRHNTIGFRYYAKSWKVGGYQLGSGKQGIATPERMLSRDEAG